MGFGHRVYRAEDPRARVLRETARRLEVPRFEGSLRRWSRRPSRRAARRASPTTQSDER